MKTTKSPQLSADWTILVFMAGDNNLDNFGATDIAEMKKSGSSEKIHVLVQRDTERLGAGTCRYRVQKGTPLKKDEVQDLGETNTGDPAVLADFIAWGAKNYPAKRTMVVLWNHGNGWDDTDLYHEAKKRGLNPPTRPAAGGRRAGVVNRGMLPANFVRRAAPKRRFRGPFFLTAWQFEKKSGPRRAIAFDDDAQDFLDNVEMKKVFDDATKAAKKKFDVIGMDACLMSMVETGLQVRHAGEVFCGSQEVEPGEGWPYDRILKALAAKPEMDGHELAALIVKEFVSSYSKSQAVTQSAFDLASLKAVQKAANELGTLLAKAYKTKDFATQGAIMNARVRAQGYEHADYVDLVDFCSLLSATLPSTAAITKKVKDAVSASVFASSAPNPKVKGSHGLSIYLPLAKVSPLYKNLDFGKGGWASFLAARFA